MYMSSIDQQFVEFIVKSLVSNPDAVIVERRIDEKGVLLELTVDPEDLGRVIGKRGATAQSLRTLLRALGTKNDARYNLKIVDNGMGGGSSRSDDTSNDSNGQGAGPVDEPAGVSVAAVSSTDDNYDNGDAGDVREDRDDDSRVSRARRELADLDDLDV
jgi:predicted RNA-binding protein YlqC (UPF0109 family)